MRDWLAHRARATPGRTALVDAGATADDGATDLAYGELDERVEELAGRLSSLGVGVDDHLGVALETRPAFVELVHAAMRLGAVLVPLNARLTAAELDDRTERADVSVLVCGADTEDAALGTGASVVSVDAPTRESVQRLDDVPAETYDLPAWDTDSPQAVLFTSGTTGPPKAVVLTMGNLLASAGCSAFRLGVRPDDRWYVPLPMYHMGGLAPVLRSTLYGTTVVVERGFDAEYALVAMREHGATCVSLVPTQLRRLLDAGALPDLRFVLLGGAPTPEDLLHEAHERDVPVCPTYGTTETASQVATALPAESREHPGTVGAPLVFTDVSVLDDGRECDPGEVGELVVSGPTVTPGYYGDPERTEAAFCQEGFRTGDAGYRDEDGRLWVLNRLDDRIVTGGENVDPGEVAATLRDHPDVSEAAVLGLPDDEWGERVGALVVADGDLSGEAVRSFCEGRLAGFKHPRAVAFVAELPRTASGTVDREAARERLRESVAGV